ncbi:MAG: radical SAM protein [Actinomycetota bacterium]
MGAGSQAKPRDWEPSYLALSRSGELGERAREAVSLLGPWCTVCPRGCRVNRLEDERGLCGVGRSAVVSSYFPHLGEEECLRGRRGSGTVFFCGCNLRCVFCQNFDISWQARGEPTGPARLARMMIELQAAGCHNINWVTPEHVVPELLEALALAAQDGLRLPIVYNSSAFDGPESLRLLDGVVDIFMPDFKLWSPQACQRYLRSPRYAEVARAAIAEMHRQVGDLVVNEEGIARRGLLLRHLVMPGLLDETEAILRWITQELGSNTYLNLMDQYRPNGLVSGRGDYPEIYRRLYPEEFRRAVRMADEFGLHRLDQRPSLA